MSSNEEAIRDLSMICCVIGSGKNDESCVHSLFFASLVTYAQNCRRHTTKQLFVVAGSQSGLRRPYTSCNMPGPCNCPGDCQRGHPAQQCYKEDGQTRSRAQKRRNGR